MKQFLKAVIDTDITDIVIEEFRLENLYEEISVALNLIFILWWDQSNNPVAISILLLKVTHTHEHSEQNLSTIIDVIRSATTSTSDLGKSGPDPSHLVLLSPSCQILIKESQNHKITEWLRSEGTSRDHLAQPTC